MNFSICGFSNNVGTARAKSLFWKMPLNYFSFQVAFFIPFFMSHDCAFEVYYVWFLARLLFYTLIVIYVP